MNHVNTLRKISGLSDSTVDWNNMVLLYIDFQNEYTDGKLKLGENGSLALDKAKTLLDIARDKSTPVFHVLHKASSASPVFNCESKMSDVIQLVKPSEDEQIVHKTLPNSFFNTELEELIRLTGRKQIIVAGFMSHMCVTATTIKAVELGYDVIVCEDACATRSLPDQNNNELDGKLVHDVSIAALSDRYATIMKLSDFA
ncbi:isochorismatase family protein [Photobacterium halotolerans]|nr:isochorismatase family protein [Photobacterium halotolerans]NAW85736.1 isochorismatase family protein [Photobacterium halotolerans]